MLSRSPVPGKRSRLASAGADDSFAVAAQEVATLGHGSVKGRRQNSMRVAICHCRGT